MDGLCLEFHFSFPESVGRTAPKIHFGAPQKTPKTFRRNGEMETGLQLPSSWSGGLKFGGLEGAVRGVQFTYPLQFFSFPPAGLKFGGLEVWSPIYLPSTKGGGSNPVRKTCIGPHPGRLRGLPDLLLFFSPFHGKEFPAWLKHPPSCGWCQGKPHCFMLCPITGSPCQNSLLCGCGADIFVPQGAAFTGSAFGKCCLGQGIRSNVDPGLIKPSHYWGGCSLQK